MTKDSKHWLDRKDYPFPPKYFELPMGKMHYVDEGEGQPIVFVHGNPGWSFEFRNIIKELSKTNRCIANDHIGFGLSDKPFDWNYFPENHTRNFKQFIDSLGLKDIVLVVNDWGGPIGLSYAIENPSKIRHIVITNSWMWPVDNDFYYRMFSGIMGGPVGRFLIKNFNFFGTVIIRTAVAKKDKFNPTIYKHLETKQDRKGSWTFPKQIIASSEWLARLWERRENLNGIGKTLIWGMKDIAFREKELNTWINGLDAVKAIKIDDVGHYPHEEATEHFIKELKGIATNS